MTHFFQRSALILLATPILAATGALCATPALARPAHHAAKKPAVMAEADADTATYKVRSGDTLEKIAAKLGTSIDELASANRLKTTSVLRPGQVLKNPEGAKPAAAKPEGKGGSGKSSKAAAAKTYTVVHGDTLFSISKRIGASVDDLRQANGLSAKAQIHAGQELKLPGGDDAAETDKTPARPDRAEAPARKGRKGKVQAEEATPPPSENAGKVVTTQAKGEIYKARAGDTLAKIADRLDTDVATLKRLNHVKGKAVRVGQLYHGPSFAEHAYTAVAGDTLASIAQRFGVSVASLRAENEMSRKVVSVRPGQKIFLPDGYRDREAPVSERYPSERYPSEHYPRILPPSRGDSGLPSTPRPYVPPAGSQVPQVQPPAPNLSDAQISQLGKGRFQWPLSGTILSDFGPKPGGQRNDGINIQADAGASVRASADGEVIYAGDQVPGFGNLVLVKHPDGWATVYAHLGHIDVKNQQKVTQGQQVGTAGSTGGVSEPQLHFEVRYAGPQEPHARSVDPKLVLPKSN